MKENVRFVTSILKKRLEEGSAKFKRLEMLLWGVYPFIVAIIIGAAKFL